MSNNMDGTKWVNYAKALSIVVAAAISIYSLFISKNTEAKTTVQQEQLNVANNKIAELENQLVILSRDIASSLTFSNVNAGDTIFTSTPILRGRLGINIPSGYEIYGVVKVENQYNVMPVPVEVEANGNWEHVFSVGSGLGHCKVGLLLCSAQSHELLQAQFKQGDWRLSGLSEGMKIIETVSVYKK